MLPHGEIPLLKVAVEGEVQRIGAAYAVDEKQKGAEAEDADARSADGLVYGKHPSEQREGNCLVGADPNGISKYFAEFHRPSPSCLMRLL